MRLNVNRLRLTELIGKIQTIVPAKPPIPILANILVEAKGSELILSATDLTVSLRAEMKASIEEEGAITLPARRFFQLIRELTSETIDFSLGQDEIIHISSGSSQFKLHGMHRSEFPVLPQIEKGQELKIDSNLLKELLIRSSFAAARDDSRHVLNGVLLQISQEKSTFIGTDGKRLAKIDSPIEFVTAEEKEFLLPLKAIEEMIKMLDSDENSTLVFMEDKIALEVGCLFLVTKLLSGQYPDIGRVIPNKENVPIISLHREELITLLRQVSLFTTDMSSSVRFVFKDGELKLQSSSSDIGEGKVSMPVNFYKEQLEIAFNPTYFLDILKHCKDETVSFAVTDAYNPGLITDSSSALFVIMPMRLT